MILYHGTNINIEQIDLGLSKPYKDFGKGFYLTDIKKQAEEMAIRKVRFAPNTMPYVNAYEFEETFLTDGSLSVKTFASPCEEWAEFIIANRYNSSAGQVHAYDVVIGPVADDGVALQIGLFKDGYIDLEALTKALAYRKLNSQYFFSTQKAINLLRRV